VIFLDEQWLVHGDRVFHACGPEVHTPLADDRIVCECNAPAPTRVMLFREWRAARSHAAPRFADEWRRSQSPPRRSHRS
jgi:hypothetical protein